MSRPRPYLLLAPALAVVIVLFGGGLLLAVGQSLGLWPIIGPSQLSTAAYRTMLADAAVWRSLALTLWVGVVSTAVSTTLALICALALRRPLRGQRWVNFLFQLNIPIPHLVGAIAILFLFSQSGLLARLAYAAGLIHDPSDFPALVYDRYGIGIMLEYVWKTTCFTGVILLANLQALGADYEAAAQTLGAGRWQRIRYVTLPLLRPALLSSSILVFAFTFGAFEVPFLLGQRANSVLPVLAYRRYVDDDLTTRPEAMALSVLISVVSLALIWGYRRTINNGQRAMSNEQ